MNASFLFGSVYLFSTTLNQINKLDFENKKIPYGLIMINSLTLAFSGSFFLFFVLYL
jgi:hypothetical protein